MAGDDARQDLSSAMHGTIAHPPLAYYNEIEPFAAQWLRNLIAAGHIALGDVDERDIRDVVPTELSRYTQCHFFAGIGIWSHALRLAGWDDSRPVWTGSCPCQPFSSAGKGDGFADDRHLWPSWHHLIRVAMPPVVFGEQIADGGGGAWLDLVCDDLEDLAFAIGPIGAPAAGFGAPNGRHRFFFVAYANAGGQRIAGNATERAQEIDLSHAAQREPAGDVVGPDGLPDIDDNFDGLMADPSPSRRRALQRTAETNRRTPIESDGHGDVGGMGHPSSPGSRRNARAIHRSQSEGESEWSGAWPLAYELEPAGDAGELGDAGRSGFQIGSLPDGRRGIVRIKGPAAAQAGVVGGFWRDADLILCRDEKDGEPDWKWRPVEEGTFPLASGDPGRVGCLRAYGNAINAQVAAHFIRVAMEVMP